MGKRVSCLRPTITIAESSVTLPNESVTRSLKTLVFHNHMEDAMKLMRRKHTVDRHRPRARNLELERAAKEVRLVLLFLFASFMLGVGLTGAIDPDAVLRKFLPNFLVTILGIGQ